MQEFAEFKLSLEAKRDAAKLRPEGARTWLAGSGECSVPRPPRDGKCDRSRGERLHRWRDSRERRPLSDLPRGPRWKEKSKSSCSSTNFSRRDNRRRSHRRRRETNRESEFSTRSTAPIQPSTSPLQTPQHHAFPIIHHPVPCEPASEKPPARLSEVWSPHSQREDVNRKCYASLDTKGLMKLSTIPFDITNGNSQMNLASFTASL